MLRLPPLLKILIQKGVWPKEGDNPNTQVFHPIVESERVKKISPDDNRIILLPPPFVTITEERNPFYTEHINCVGQIFYDKAVCIADFGPGSDSPIILYYQNPEEPCVMYLQWKQCMPGVIEQNWVKTHNSFKEFVIDIGLYEDNS